MNRFSFRKLQRLLLGAGLALLFVTASSALAGSGVGEPFTLGQPNTVDATTELSGNTDGPQLKVANAAAPAIWAEATGTTASPFGLYALMSTVAPTVATAAVRGENAATNAYGYGVWGSQAGSGIGVYGTSPTGTGVYGKHTASTGKGTAGVQGESASAAAAGVVGKNTAGGPGVRAVVNAGVAPLAVNSATRVPNLNADLLDGIDSNGFLRNLVPLSLTGSTASNGVITAMNTGSANGVQGEAGSGASGVYGQNDGAGFGVAGRANAPGGVAVLAESTGGAPPLAVVTGGSGAAPISVDSQTKVDNLNADLLDGLDSDALQRRVSGTCAAGQAIGTVNADGTVGCHSITGSGGSWSMTGNAGTTPGTNFLGTSDNVPLELKVNGQRAFRIEPTASTPNLIGGFPGNSVTAGVGIFGATIGGGGQTFGLENKVSGAGVVATIGGGRGNRAAGLAATVAGGGNNVAVGNFSAVGGGYLNTATGWSATVAGGTSNQAGGKQSFAAGTRAKATRDGSFVWGDSTEADITSPAANTFSVRAGGGIWLGTTSTPAITSGHFIDTSTGGYLSSSGVWTSTSDRALKHALRPLDRRSVLEKVARMPITSWSYKTERPSIRHIGPMAQDFYNAFGLGLDDKHITTIDEGGVALAAIQALYRQNQALRRDNRALTARLERLERAVGRLSREGRKSAAARLVSRKGR